MSNNQAGSWRATFGNQARLRVVTTIICSLKRLLPLSSPEGFLGLTNIAVIFEEIVYISAVSQDDYLRRIATRMFLMEMRHNAGTLNVFRPVQPQPEMDDCETSRRAKLPAEYRQRIMTNILDTLRTHLPISTPKEVLEATEGAVTLERKIYNSATDQSDYLSKIALKMLSIEVNSQNSNVATSSSWVEQN